MHQRRCRVTEKMDEEHRSEFEILNKDASGESTNEQDIDVKKLAKRAENNRNEGTEIVRGIDCCK